MKPFNLEEAIELHKPVVTRDGRAVILAGYNPRAIERGRIVGWLNDGACYWYENGRFASDRETNRDLFMENKEAYVGFFTDTDSKGKVQIRTTEYAYDTEEEANEVMDDIIKTEFWSDIQNRQVIKINI